MAETLNPKITMTVDLTEYKAVMEEFRQRLLAALQRGVRIEGGK